MQLVIDLPKDVYSRIKFYREFRELNDYVATLKAIDNAVIIPAGHGRLGDLGALVDAVNEAQLEGTDEYKGLGVAKQLIVDAPTVVKADRGGTQ